LKAVFLDRDGTINAGIPKYERVDSIDKIELFPDTLEALALLAELDYGIFFVTNQAGIAEGLITIEEFNAINDEILRQIEPSDAVVLETFVCPHGERDACACRKPQPTMLLEAAKKYEIDLANSYMVGDRLSDIETGINAGTQTILVQTGAITDDRGIATYTASTLLDAARYIVEHS
jgi:D-glycero-D-manno-heptose 1,7-bisphosphate phosphatase